MWEEILEIGGGCCGGDEDLKWNLLGFYFDNNMQCMTQLTTFI